MKALSLVLASIETENSNLRKKAEGLDEENAAISEQRGFYADVAFTVAEGERYAAVRMLLARIAARDRICGLNRCGWIRA
jgi:hypothetical protein